jgi:AraC family transcriptional regulator of adaptative response/methylated-DNA-[protein]-cysteine methyltransferase
VAGTLRVRRAKLLLDRTKLPMADVAARADFASLRRFNAVFAEIYKRTPSKVRRLHSKPA